MKKMRELTREEAEHLKKMGYIFKPATLAQSKIGNIPTPKNAELVFYLRPYLMYKPKNLTESITKNKKMRLRECY